MKVIGIDYGEKKTGIAFAESPLATPIEVIYHKDEHEFLAKLQKVLHVYQPEVIVVGMPSGTQGEEVKVIVEFLKNNIGTPIETIDEGFSTKEAKLLSREAGHKRKKRKKMEDAFSASIILQKYLDSL
jgi:putative holliday junction resolvase